MASIELKFKVVDVVAVKHPIPQPEHGLDYTVALYFTPVILFSGDKVHFGSRRRNLFPKMKFEEAKDALRGLGWIE